MTAPLRILHVLRAPVGGLFRHVFDLAREQAARGHAVGIVADASTGGAAADAALQALAPDLKLGVSRVAMSRHLGMGDLSAVRHLNARAAAGIDVLHGHGAKGGAYVRLARAPGALRVYTPHGGSLHYSATSPVGFIYLTLEKVLARRTNLFLFESAYGLNVFKRKIGPPPALARVVHNGVRPDEFAPVALRPDATDLLFIGELRTLKGVDLLIAAIAALRAEGPELTATLVGDGPDAETLREDVRRRGLADAIHFTGALPARDAFTRGRLLCVPSRAESLPYIVLEAAAAGVPLVVSNVGGIPEIFGDGADALVEPDDVAALTAALRAALAMPGEEASNALRARVAASFTVSAMTDSVLDAYAAARGTVKPLAG